uniref:uncharacterized protein LOC124060811 isoform X2 n=1 Tax=Scatophagus argus TaxID=75038 RepID=UPI001ED7D064|nr:uncharacterized protein LOC124060811 isoform X2 [Scatophagus argus]
MTENNMESAEKGAGCVRLKKQTSVCPSAKSDRADKGRHRSSSNFKRITAVPLLSKFFSELDIHSNLMKVFAKKGGAQGRKIKTTMAPIIQADTISAGRESFLKGLCVYLNEDPQKLVKEDLDVDSIRMALAETPIGVFVVGHEGAELGDVGIALEGVEVMGNQRAKSFSARVGFYYYYYY